MLATNQANKMTVESLNSVQSFDQVRPEPSQTAAALNVEVKTMKKNSN